MWSRPGRAWAITDGRGSSRPRRGRSSGCTGGRIPDDAEAVRALPGVGPYIAGAVLSFAFDRPEPIVEANSQRVLARLVALRDDLKIDGRPAGAIWQAAGRLVPPRGAGDFNQALMDLGAMVCTPRQPAACSAPWRPSAGRGAWASRT